MNNFYLSKKQTNMTKGISIIFMLIVHLFCRVGNDVYGSPWIWVNATTPLNYYIGQFSIIALELFCIVSGYSFFILGENKKLGFSQTIYRIFKFLVSAWIILILFTLVNLIFKGSMKINFKEFVLYFFMLKKFNGAWWYVSVYCFILISSKMLYLIMKKLNSYLVLAMFLATYLLYVFIIYTFGSLSNQTSSIFLNYFADLTFNYFKILPSIVIGLFISKEKIIYKLSNLIRFKFHNVFLIILLGIISALYGVFYIGYTQPFFAFFFFIIFNMIDWKKFGAVLNYFGNHSTNMWLVHMFFYTTMFAGLVQKTVYPVFMFSSLLGLSLISSYIIKLITKPIFKFGCNPLISHIEKFNNARKIKKLKPTQELIECANSVTENVEIHNTINVD